MTALGLLRRAVGQVLDNLGVALQMSGLLTLVQVLAGEEFLARAVLHFNGFLVVPGRFVWELWAGAILLSVLPPLWIAVGWHRFILLGEQPWYVVPRFHGGRILGYGLRGVGVVVLVLLGMGAVVVLGPVVGGVLGLVASGFAGRDAAFDTVIWRGRNSWNGVRGPAGPLLLAAAQPDLGGGFGHHLRRDDGA